MIDLRVLKYHELGNHIFSGWSGFLYLSVNRVTPKQIISENPSLVFHSFTVCVRYTNFPMKIGKQYVYRDVQKCSNMLFSDTIFEIKILMDLRALKSVGSENHNFSWWSGFVFVSVNAITPKQII